MKIEFIENKIVECLEDPECFPDPRGLGVVFMEKMKEYKDNIAQIDAETGQTLTHGEILLESIRVAQNIQKRKINSDDIIVLCSYNNMECVFPVFAGFFTGIRVAALDPSLPKNDCEYLLKMVKPRYVFCDNSSVKLIDEVLKVLKLDTEIVFYGETSEYTQFSIFRQPTGTENTFLAKPVKDLNDTAMIYFSSGTTGYPKGVCVSHYGLHTQQASLTKQCDLSVILIYSTYYWISATMFLIASLLKGTSRIVAKPFNPDTVLQIIQKYNVTLTVLAPIYLHKLITKFTNKKYDSTSLSALMIIGAKLTAEQLRAAKKLFPNTIVSNPYGMTELSGYINLFNIFRDKHLLEKNIESCGLPFQGITYKIVDLKTGKPLGPYEQGELRLKSKAVTTGYLNNPEATENAFDDEGFFKTGDIAYYDKDFCFFIIDRIKDIVKYRNFIQSTLSMEQILLDHPDILEAAVTAKPHPEDGDHAAAFIVLKKDSTVTKEEILTFYNEKICYYEPKFLRGGLYIVDKIPRTPSGKARKMELRNNIL